jgi:sugar-specific transcriptional regulator TrmB
MEILKNIGFSPDQIAVYTTLLEYKKLPASAIASKSKVSRVITYNILSHFVDMGVAEKIEAPKSIALFSASSPENLRKLIERKKNEANSFESACEQAIATLKPKFNLLSNKPGVSFYEGVEGIWKVLEDTLYTEETIYMYVDMEAVIEHFADINKEYGKRRERAGIKKKVIVADTPLARSYFIDKPEALIDVRFAGKEKIPFGSAMYIYENKISYITIGEEKDSLVGIIIKDPHIAKLHKYFFECLYDTTPAV